MINRLKEYFGESEEEKPEEDFWEVAGDGGWFYVTRATALDVARQLQRLRPPRWLRFRDLFGADVRVRSADVNRVTECTTGHRAAEREFRRARRLEEKADRRPWEDDDW